AALHVERPRHRKEAALVIERAHLGSIEERAGRAVGYDRTVIPAVPQPAHRVDKLGCDLIAQIMVVMLRAAEIERRGARAAGHHVPGRTAAAQVIEGSKGARDVVRLAKARRYGRAKADMGCDRAQGADQGRGLKARNERSM